MIKRVFAVLTLTSSMCLISALSHAAPFEEVFKLSKIVGECTVQAPGAAQFVNAVDDQAYPWGTKIKTGRKSSVLVTFSEGNTCRVLANAVLTITKDVKDEKLKNIVLDAGKVEVKLEPEFHKTNNDSLNVVTPTAICGAIGCIFSVDVRNEKVEKIEFIVSVIMCDDGQILVNGHDFKIPMDKEDGMVVATPTDRSFIRIKNIKGNFSAEIRDSEGQPKTVELKIGAVIKIWRAKSSTGNMWIVTILIEQPDGTLGEAGAISYNEEIAPGEEGAAEEGAGAKGAAEEGTGAKGAAEEGAGEKGAAEDTGGKEAEAPRTPEDLGEVFTTTTTTTSTTTTTTIPLNLLVTRTSTPTTTTQHHRDTPTPVGRR